MQLARAIHFDESDLNVFHCPARTGEWCLSGGFEFSNWSEGDLTGKARQAFANGWLDRDRTILETMMAFRRAGADAVLTYFAPDIAKLLHQQR